MRSSSVLNNPNFNLLSDKSENFYRRTEAISSYFEMPLLFWTNARRTERWAKTVIFIEGHIFLFNQPFLNFSYQPRWSCFFFFKLFDVNIATETTTVKNEMNSIANMLSSQKGWGLNKIWQSQVDGVEFSSMVLHYPLTQNLVLTNKIYNWFNENRVWRTLKYFNA